MVKVIKEVIYHLEGEQFLELRTTVEASGTAEAPVVELDYAEAGPYGGSDHHHKVKLRTKEGIVKLRDFLNKVIESTGTGFTDQ